MDHISRVAVLRGAGIHEPPLALPGGAIDFVLDAWFDYHGLERLEGSRAEVVLLDLRGMRGSPTAPMAAVRAALPSARIVVVGTPGDEDMARAALGGGASGYVSRNATIEALRAAINDAAKGALHLTSTGQRVAQKMIAMS